jgi:exonuclease III
MAKKTVIRKIIREESVDMLCLQETKVELVDFRLCSNLWGADDIEWVSKHQMVTLGDC